MIGTKQWVYLDACIVIYLVEQKNDYWRSLQQHFETYVNQGHQFVVSELTRMECLTQPLRQKNALLHDAFERFFNSNTHVIADLKRPVFDLATHLRANHSLKTPDALHLAAAIHYGCHEFWTNDHRLQKAASDHLQVINLFAPQGTA